MNGQTVDTLMAILVAVTEKLRSEINAANGQSIVSASIDVASLEWALDFTIAHSDGDLFPRVPEVDAIAAQRAEFIQLVAGQPLAKFPPGASRRFIVPKDEFSYRQATQLDPQDSIILSALIHQFGDGIEKRRLPRNTVFSYRFAAASHHDLYQSGNAWNDFWDAAISRLSKPGYVVYCDISDFYNQIYHHTVENQLIASDFPNQAIQWIKLLLESTTAGVSRGVPIGPHAIHLIAEATLVPIDNSMETAGLNFIRYADDILVFVPSEKEARNALLRLAQILDKQQRLTLQRHKSKVLKYEDAVAFFSGMREDRPISEDEDAILDIIRKYSGGDPYVTISYNSISQDDWLKITPDLLSHIIIEYLSKDPVDYIRLRWLYRRLTQIGHPGALGVSLEKIEHLMPCIASICLYISSVQNVSDAEWKAVGEKLLKLLDTEEISANEYFRLSVLSLFTRNAHVNHFVDLARRFEGADAYAKREILLAAKINGAADWMREYKEAFAAMDPWQKMAFIYGASAWPKDEKRFFITQNGGDRPIDIVLGKWSKAQ